MLERRTKIAFSFSLIAVVVSFGIAFLTPEDILSYAWAKFLVSITAMIIPNVANEQFVGDLSGVAQFHSTVRWVLTPLVFVMLWRIHAMWPREEIDQRKEENLYSKYSRWRLLFIVVVAPTLTAVYWFSPFDADLSRGERFHYGSRFGLGFIGTIVFIGIPFVLLGTYEIAKDFRKWLLRRKA